MKKQNKQKTWKERITEACEQAGTYQPNFEAIVETLATILEQRDAAFEQFIAEGAEFVVTHKLDRGNENKKINPLLQVWDTLNKTALSYWKELGGTPAGLKKITSDAISKQQVGFEQLLAKLK